MTISSLPPSGHGVYARAQGVDFLRRFDFVCLNGNRADIFRKAGELKNLGVKVWLYTTVENWLPHVWQGHLPLLISRARRANVEGIIADPENGWGADPNRNALARALGIELKRQTQAANLRLGISSFPLFPALEPLAEAVDGHAWGTPQLYAKDAYYRVGKRGLTSWYARWERMFGRGKVIPSVSLWVSDRERLNNRAAYLDYLQNVPTGSGIIGWTTGGTPSWMVDAYFSRAPGGSMVGTWAYRLANLFFNVPVVGIVALVFMLVIGGMLWLV